MLSIEHLSVDYYRRGQTVHAVQDLSLAIGDAEAVGLVGESGSGKSTIALAILRLIRGHEGRITQGRIRLDGRDLLELSEVSMREVRGRQIAMIFQDPFTSMNPVLRIRDQMEEVFRAHGLGGGPAELARSLEQVQLDPARVLDSYPHQLSGGQRQRVMIAMALLAEPKLLLADEPTTALDVLVQKDILELLFSLQRSMRLSLLFISHNLALVAQTTNRIAVMQAGRVVEEGPSRALFSNPSADYTRQLLAAIPRLARGGSPRWK